MSSVEIRPFQRPDREQLTGLVNAHVGAVLPGVSVSVNAVMSQLEREPGEAIVDPWVVERRTLVAVERDAVAAGAHLLRYGSDERVSESYRNAGEIRWLVCHPDSLPAGAALLAACIEVLDGWRVDRQYADCSLPSLATYGVAACWPHLRELYTSVGFAVEGRVEIILVARVDELPRAVEPPLAGLSCRRSVGSIGTRFSAVLGDDVVGCVEVMANMTSGGTHSSFAGWSDVGNLCVREDHRRRGIATWLVSQAAEWLRLGRVERLLDYAWPEEEGMLAFLASVGFRELVRTERGWRRQVTGG